MQASPVVAGEGGRSAEIDAEGAAADQDPGLKAPPNSRRAPMGRMGSWNGGDMRGRKTRGRQPGRRIPIGDPRYSTLVRAFNLRWAGTPRYVELCRHTGEVIRAVQAALDQDLRLTVRSGGHCYEDFAVGNDGGVIVDVSMMNEVYRDPATGWYCVEAGATLWDVYLSLYRAHGVTLPGGSCYSVGAAGHVTGGGYGALSRLHGLTVDYLHAVEVVHVTRGRRAEAIIARRDAADPDERDLLWGHLGGGGGNFGIVTRFWFKDPPTAPARAQSLGLSVGWQGLGRADLGRVVHAYDGFLEANSGVDSPYGGLDTSLALLHKSSGGALDLEAEYAGDRPDLFAAFGALMADAMGLPAPTIQELPWLFAVQSGNGSGPNRRAKQKSAYMIKPLPDGQLDVLWDFLTRDSYRNATALVALNAFGGKINAVDPAATAVPQRSSILKIQYQSYWIEPAEDAVHLDWMRELYAAMYGPRGPIPDGTMDGCYVNYPDVDLEDWALLYYKDNYPRLRRVKGRWDPLDIFHHRQSIELPAP
jgi:FAD/FMN-containing dehydrogenase